MRVMIATDGTAASEPVFMHFGHVFRLPELLDELIVIHVRDTTFNPLDVPFQPLLVSHPEGPEAQGLDVLNEARAMLGPLGERATYLEVAGAPGPELVRQVREHQVDLLIVGRGQDHAHDRALMGSVSSHVVAHAPCTVVVVK